MEASGFWQQNKLQVDGKQRHYTDTATNIVWYKWQKKKLATKGDLFAAKPAFPKKPSKLPYVTPFPVQRFLPGPQLTWTDFTIMGKQTS